MSCDFRQETSTRRSNVSIWRRTMFCGVAAVIVSAVALAGDKPKDGMKIVDSGSFGVFMNGRRVATETFSIQQGPNGSIATSEFKTDQGNSSQTSQSSELDLSSSGDIRKYEW